MQTQNFYDRELSWLSFNYRVLQEAKDPSVPLYERIKFLAIYSSNLDEFFRVRVASLRSLLNLKKKSQKDLGFDPEELLNNIHVTVDKQQEEMGDIFRNQILVELKKNNILLIDETKLSKKQKSFIKEYFEENILQYIQPVLLVKKKIVPFLKNKQIYFAVKLAPKNSSAKSAKRIKHKYALIEIPVPQLPRFIELPKENEKNFIIFIDDIIRFHLPVIFNAFDVVEAYSIKLTRDAELYIDDEFTGNLLNKIRKGIKKRDTGVPSRFLFDNSMPKDFLRFLQDGLILEKEDLVPGGRYHNFNDFFSFPNPGSKKLEYNPLSPLNHKELETSKDIFTAISKKDYGIHPPFQKYDYVIDFLNRAADDENVTSIKITQYRVADNSSIVKALIRAAKNKKDVMAFVELKARFDEEANIQWAEEMEKAGVKVHYSLPGLKVHAKIALVQRKENDRIKNYCYLATGNFNEKTARIYSDFGLFTADERLTYEIEKLLDFLSRRDVSYKFKHLLVAQFNMRKAFSKMIDNEIKFVNEGKEAKILLKMNSLEDKKMIRKLYEASQAGVKIDIIVRGICCLIPGVKGLSENINVISIVDRFLEHTRFYMFNNDEDEKIYAASADWMKRNLSRRIEAAFPIYDDGIRKEIKDIIQLQLNDNSKARVIDKAHKNKYKKATSSNTVQSQTAIYDYLKEIHQ